MKTGKMKWFGKAAGAGLLALTMAAPALQAQSFNDHRQGQSDRSRDNRGDNGQYDNGGRSGQSDRGRDNQQYDRRDNQQHGQYDRRDNDRSYRENQRVNVQGRVTSFSRERNGYRINLDRGRDSYWVPESYFRGHNLRVGISVVLGGIFRGGAINIDAVSWPDGGGYGPAPYERGFVAGVIERIDYRDGTMLVRDRDGRMITADTSRWGTRDLRRGDYVELSGDFTRGGLFRISRIDNVRSGRY